jgi:hypothetical protein
VRARYLLLALVLWSCGEPAGPAPSAPRADLFDWIPPPPPSPPPVGLLSCTPLPYDSVTETIGVDGGTIKVGAHKLFVPAGALAEPVTITAVAPSDTINRVHFEPEGLQFQEPAYLRMSYENCNVLGLLLPKRIAYTTGDLTILEYLLSFDNVFSQKVTGEVRHFSDYAISW